MSEGTYPSTRDCGLLVIRIGLGVAFLFHGWPKITGGPKTWEALGGMAAMPMPTVAGFVGSIIEFGGALLVMVGLLFRPVCLLLFLQMAVAVFLVHLRHHDGFNVYSHALEDGFVFLGLALIGPGRFSIDARK